MNLPAKAEQAAADFSKTASERYAEAIPLRVAMVHVPIIGPTLDLMWSTRGQNVSQVRTAATLAALHEEFSRANEAKVDKEFLESEEFYDLVWRVFENGQRTREQERIACCARILRGASEAVQGREGAEAYMAFAMELSADEMRTAVALRQRFGVDAFVWPNISDWIHSQELTLDEHRRVLEVISRLQAKQVLRLSLRIDPMAFRKDLAERISGSGLSRAEFLQDEFQFSDFFCNFMGFLNGIDRAPPAGDPASPEQ